MRPDALLFDLDGTLTDSVGLIVHCCQRTFQTFLGRDVPSEELIPHVGRSLFALFDEYDARQQPEMVAFYRALYVEHHDDWVQLFPGIDAMLDGVQAAGLPIGIVTSKGRESARPALERFGLSARLQTLVTYDDTERHKPEPEPLLLAAAHLGLAPERCWYVGDATHDLRAARAAGMMAVAALWGPMEQAILRPLADHALERPEALLDFL